MGEKYVSSPCVEKKREGILLMNPSEFVRAYLLRLNTFKKYIYLYDNMSVYIILYTHTHIYIL